ncbi:MULTISPECIES: biotin carboxylase N-terminal domain-containing protein [unclassified Spirillospora]|uniref:ATP-binding protein n=1 Tax=unclassified Spirillospora TaxID=2642701 RepID=UPI0037152B62
MSRTLLIADQGKTAIRIAQAAADLGWHPFALRELLEEHPQDPRRVESDEAGSRNRRHAAAERILWAAARADAGLVHPGRGALSRDAGFARRCARHGLTVVGPPAGVLKIVNDRGLVRCLADAVGVPVAPGPPGPVSWDDAEEFLAALQGRAALIRPVSSRGPQGGHVVTGRADLDRVHARLAGTGSPPESTEVYIEEFLEQAGRVEVQIAGDGRQVAHLWERQPLPRRTHRTGWLAPAGGLAASTRFLLLDAALRLADAVAYRGVGTMTFLLTPSRRFYLTGVDPRLHSGHFVTERLAGLDLFAAQLRLARGDTVGDLGLEENLRASLPLPEQTDRDRGGQCRPRGLGRSRGNPSNWGRTGGRALG